MAYCMPFRQAKNNSYLKERVSVLRETLQDLHVACSFENLLRWIILLHKQDFQY